MPDLSSLLSPIENPWALAGLLLIFPILLLYLLKPKPKHVFFPSIMFIKRMEKTKRFSSILKRFIRDPLLILQLLVVCLLVASAANPRYNAVEQVDVVEHVVFVLDASASMKSSDVSPTRFDKAKKTISDMLSGMDSQDRASIVLAESTPILAVHQVRAEDAMEALDKVSAADTPSNIGDAILYSIDIASKVNVAPKIVVVSDLSGQRGMDPNIARKRASNQNITVVFYDVSGSGENVGITSLTAERLRSEKTSVLVSFSVGNYGQNPQRVSSRILVDGVEKKTLSGDVAAGETELFSEEVGADYGEHNITVALANGGALKTDDAAYAVVPTADVKKVLFISNDEYGNQYIKYALESSEHTVVESNPPVTPPVSGFDVVVLGHFDETKILPGTFEGVKKLVSDGGVLVISASGRLPYLNNEILSELSPVTHKATIDGTAFVERNTNHEVVDEREVSFSETVLKRYLDVKPKDGAKTILSTKDGVPLLVYREYGRGVVVYVGISSNPEWTNFYYTSSYPIFWMRLIDWSTARKGELGVKSFSTGDFTPKILNATIVTPSRKTVPSTNILLDEVGYYALSAGGSTDYFAVNLADSVESNVTKKYASDSIESKVGYVGVEKQRVLKNSFDAIAALVILLILFEAYYLRGRGYYGS